jgi:hypothetical protein
MQKLPISIGVLAWNSGQTLVDTLQTYYENRLIEMANDVTILFQEFSLQDKQIAEHFGLPYIAETTNIGIGKAFKKMTENAKTENILVLEHDWKLIEDTNITHNRLLESLEMLNGGFDVVRLRHRRNPGYPLFSYKFKGRELTYYDDWHECTSPHLLDSIHWCEPDIDFPDKISKIGDIFWTTSRYGNWTNNPCLYRKEFYLNVVEPFMGEGIDLERKIAYWWPRQNFKVAHGEGLFKHIDDKKYGR